MTFTISEKLEGSRNLIPIGENLFENIAKLASAGFDSFLPHVEFVESFCKSSERDELREYLKESAKEGISCIDPIDPTLTGKGRCAYRSPFLERLRQRRDERNGENFDAALKRDGHSAIQIADFALRMEKLRHFEPERYDALRQPYLERERQLRSREIERFNPNGVHDYLANDRKIIRGHCAELTGKILEPFGYRPAKLWSSDSQAVFRKDFGDGLSLAWVVDMVNFEADMSLNSIRGFTDFRLSVRHNNKRSEIGSFHIRYNYGFLFLSWIYSKFQSRAELEVVIRAHVTAYAIVEKSIMELANSNDWIAQK